MATGPMMPAPMSDVRIVTVTPNPAIDRVLIAEQFAVGEHVRAKRIGWYPGGKGINVSRVLAMLGTRSVATGFVGKDELATFEEYLERVGGRRIVMQLLMVRGRTRENTTIMDPVMDTETHIRDEGFTVQLEDVRRLTSKVGMLAREGSIVVIAGSLPPGVRPGDLRTMMHLCHDHGAHLVVDTSETALDALRDEPMWLLKLNAKELADLTGMPTETEDQVIAAARSMSVTEGGLCQHVAATRGAAGAVLVTPKEILSARVFVHPGLIANTVGCGDSLLAGMLHSFHGGQSWESALRMGVATATANATSRTPGTIDRKEIAEFFDAATVDRHDLR